MDPSTGLDVRGKSRPPPGFNPRTAQPAASRYADCTIPAHQRKAQFTENKSTSCSLATQ